MQILDNPKIYHQIDPEDWYGSLSKIGRQFDSGWHSAEFVNLNFDTGKIKNIVFTGMGGSNLSAQIALSLAPFLLSIPFEIVANYRLPAYAGKDTLVILSSYSGNTEEIISCAQDSIMRGCHSVSITTGGKLKKFSEENHLPIIELDTKINPSSSPRAGIGLSLGATVSLLLRINPEAKRHFSQKDISETIERMVDATNPQKDTSDNPAKSLALKHKETGIIFLSANHLSGIGMVFQSYINETAKTFCNIMNFPNLNHHFLDGLTFPTSLKDNVHFLILNSNLFPEAIKKRVMITKDILSKQKYRVTVIKPEANEPVLQVFESLVFLIMFSYYLSIVNKVNPASNPWVDYLKKEIY